MNPRIRELAEQAGSTHKLNLGVYQFYTDELERFAELIVRECAQLVKSTQLTEDGHTWRSADYVVLEHFGVEE